MKRRSFVVQRWDFREQEKRELEAEAKRKAGVSTCANVPKNFGKLVISLPR